MSAERTVGLIATPDAELQAAARRGGVAWSLAAVLGYSGANLFGRAGVTVGDPLAAPLLRDLPSLVMGLVLMARTGAIAQLRPGDARFVGRPLLLFVASGAVSVVGTFAFFFALRLGGVAIAVPVLQTQLIWGALFGSLLLDERLDARATLGVATAFAGLLVLGVGQARGEPVSDLWLLGGLLALVPAVAWGLSGVIWRKGQVGGVERGTGIALHYATAVAVTSLVLVSTGAWRVYGSIRPEDFAALLAAGLFGGVLAVYAMFSALRVMPAAAVYVLLGATPIVTALAAGMLLGERFDAITWSGIVLASLGIVLFQLAGAGHQREARSP